MTQIAEYDYIDALARRFSKYSVEPDPVMWTSNTFNIDLYSMQRTVLRLIEIVPKVVVRSCHNSGKTKIAAIAVARFIAKHPAGTARVITTAPSGSQVRGIMWNEINALFDQANALNPGTLPGRVNQTEWWIGNWMAGIGRKPKDRPKVGGIRSPETFHGLHAEHLLIIIDEAGGISDELWIGVDTLATNVGARILAIGNPDDPDSGFANIIKNAEKPKDSKEYNGWTSIHLPAWKTPNLSGEHVSPLLQRVLLSKQWVEDKRKQWGEDSGLWTAKIEAEFPDNNILTIIKIADVSLAQQGIEQSSNGFEDVQLGVDIAASETGDETVVRERRGHRLLRRWSCQSSDPEEITGLIVEAQVQSGATLLHVDATGVGFGFISDLRKELPGVAVLPFVAAARADNTKEFENKRAEAYWYLRDQFRRREIDLSALEHADDSISQLTSIKYKIKNGRIIVEPKSDVRTRIGRSPDDADAIVLATMPPNGSYAPASAQVKVVTKKQQQEMMYQRRRRHDITAYQPTNRVSPRIRSLRARST